MAEIQKKDCWLGIDLGTSSVKIVLINNNGEVLDSGVMQTQADVKSDIGDCGYEQNPLQILSVTKSVLHKILDLDCCVKGIGVTGQMHGVMLWSKKKTDLMLENWLLTDNVDDNFCMCYSNLYTWQDQRCSQEFLASLPIPSDPHQKLSTGFGCSTLYWLAHHQPELLNEREYDACGTIMDFLVYLLCGLDHPVTSDQLATSFGFYSRERGTWDKEFSESQSVPHHLMPCIVPAGTVVGHTSKLDFVPQGVPVFVGIGDVQCAMRAVLKSPHDAAMNLSTSIQLGFIVTTETEPRIKQDCPKCISVIPYFDRQQLALFAGLNGGNTIYCFAESVLQWVTDLGIASEIDITSMIKKLQNLSEAHVSAASPLNETLAIDPVLFGERHDKEMKAAISGLDFSNIHNIGLIFHALSEGIVDHLYRMVSKKFLLRVGIQRLLVSGSVAASNTSVMNRLKNLYGSDKEVLGRHQDGTSSTVCGDAETDMGKASAGDGRYGISGSSQVLEVVTDNLGLDAVSSALGAAYVSKDLTTGR